MLKKLMLNVHHFNVFVHHFYVKVKVHITIYVPTYSKKFKKGKMLKSFNSKIIKRNYSSFGDS